MSADDAYEDYQFRKAQRQFGSREGFCAFYLGVLMLYALIWLSGSVETALPQVAIGNCIPREPGWYTQEPRDRGAQD